MTLSRFGKHLEETVSRAAAKPEQPPFNPNPGQLHNEGDRWWRFSEGWTEVSPSAKEIASHRVSQEAERVESYDQVGAALAKALGKVVRPFGWTVSVVYSFQECAYSVKMVKPQWAGPTSVYRWVPDEELNENTTSVEKFSKYVKTLAASMREEGGDALEHGPVLSGRGSSYEATGRGTRGARVSQVIMDEASVFRRGAPSERELELEEERAIESIKRTLDKRSDS